MIINMPIRQFRKSVMVLAVTLPVIFSSCGGKKSLIAGSWQGAKVENDEMESFYSNSQKYIDTMGSSKDPRINWELYGVTNMDSMRKEMQLQLDSARAMQRRGLNNTYFVFNKDGKVYISFNGNIDTSKWSIVNDKELIFEEMSGKDRGTKTQMTILNLTENELKLKLTQDSAVSTVTLVRTNKSNEEIFKAGKVEGSGLMPNPEENPHPIPAPPSASQPNEESGKKNATQLQ